MGRIELHELGDYLAERWGYTTDATMSEVLKGHSDVGGDPATIQVRDNFFLASITKHLLEQVAETRALRRELAGLGRKIADGIAAGEERKAKAIEKAEAAKEKAANAERDAKLDARPVVVIQCPNEVLERIPGRRLRGKW